MRWWPPAFYHQWLDRKLAPLLAEREAALKDEFWRRENKLRQDMKNTIKDLVDDAVERAAHVASENAASYERENAALKAALTGAQRRWETLLELMPKLASEAYLETLQARLMRRDQHTGGPSKWRSPQSSSSQRSQSQRGSLLEGSRYLGPPRS